MILRLLNTRYLLLVILLLTGLTNCNKPRKHQPIWSETPCGKMDVSWTEDPTQTMKFSFENKKQILEKLKLDSNSVLKLHGYMDSLISYKNNNRVFYLPYILVIPVDSSLKSLYISTGSLMNLSWSGGIKEFYINWPNNNTDTLYCDFRKDNTRNNPCCCQYPLISMTLNGKSFTRKTDDFRYGTYLFDK